MTELELAQLRFIEKLKSNKASDEPRINVYRSILRENYYSLIVPCFPVVKKIIGEQDLKHLIDEFFEKGSSSSPYFHHLPKAFIEFWHQSEASLPYPFLLDLMHYEWLEMHLECLDEQEESAQVLSIDDFCTKPFRLSRLARIKTYQYPVDKIGVTFKPSKPEATIMLLYRLPSHKVAFIKLSPMTLQLIEAVTEFSPVIESINKVYESLDASQKEGFADLDAFIPSAIETLTRLHQQQVLLLN